MTPSYFRAGAVGTQAACDRAGEYIDDARPPVRLAVAAALARCGRTGDVPMLLARLEIEKSADVRANLFEALGYAGGEVALAALEAGLADRDDRLPALYGLLQALAYGSVSAEKRPNLPFSQILGEIMPERGEEARLAAYFLSRLSDIPQVIDGAALLEAYRSMGDPTVKALILRIMRQYVENAEMIEAAKQAVIEEGGHLGTEALRTLAAIDPSPVTTELLIDFAGGEDIYVAEAALSALARRNDMTADRLAAAQQALSAESKWIQVRGLELLLTLDKPAALRTAEGWLAEGRYYRSFRLLQILAGDADGQTLLDRWAADNPDTVLAREISNMANPVQPVPQPTPDFAEAVDLTDGVVTLETTKGDISFALNRRVPFAVHNLVRYVEAGHMADSYWHRVIPGFVAQWGQSRKAERLDWGTVRDDVQSDQHTPGTVGMATNGKDTGGTQFFINTTYNIHLNGRYTVVGQVISGYDVALSMEEGDKVISARYEAPSDE